MPFLWRDNEKIHYEIQGDPAHPAVILQHPLCSEPSCFEQTSLAKELLERGYFLILPSSLAHGQSSVPRDLSRYALKERNLDQLAVLDELGVARAAYVGYSMGSWLGCGLLHSAPERIVCASLGGFDLIQGAHGCGIPRRFVDSWWGYALLWLYARWSESLIDPQTADLRALQRCFSMLYDPMPGLEALAQADCPISLWCARHDLYCKHMAQAARALSVPLHVFPGHHFSASSDERIVPIITDFLDEAWPGAQGPVGMRRVV